MTRRRLFAAAACLLLLGTGGALAKVKLPAASTDPAAANAPARAIAIGWLGLTNDPRHAPVYAYTRTELRPADDPVAGAEMGIADEKTIADASGLAVTLDRHQAPDAAGLVAALNAMAKAGERFVLVDLPGDLLGAVAAQAKSLDLTLINVSAPDNSLRDLCDPKLLHTAASDRMETDALVQFLRVHNWNNILVLEGEAPRDKAFGDSFAASAARLRLNVVATRSFTLKRDPANREANNAALLTGGVDYDVVFIADSDGEFARYLPFTTQLPRPLIGSAGLVPSAWNWTFERYGAPQVNSRFIKATGRHMSGADWAAWVAARTVVDAYARAGTPDPNAVDAYLRSDQLRADGSKGVTLDYRPWDGQMRQPILLGTEDAVIDVAPLSAFQHQFNTLDTLGEDEPEHKCP
ncbi:MAG: amino acid ABC transporter substrate-binding protein [Devosia sp.]